MYHGLAKGEYVSDDGFVYAADGERLAPWYFTLNTKHDYDRKKPDEWTTVFRRDRINLKRVEAVRWRALAFIDSVVQPRVKAAALAILGVEDPHYYDDETRVNLCCEKGRYGYDYNVNEDRVEQPDKLKLIERIGHVQIDTPGFLVGTHWKRMAEWSSSRFGFLHRINALLEALLVDLMSKTLEEGFQHSERFRYRKVFVLVNGRRYPAHDQMSSKGTGVGWPSPDDIVLDVDNMAPPRTRLYSEFGHEITPKKPKKSKPKEKVSA